MDGGNAICSDDERIFDQRLREESDEIDALDSSMRERLLIRDQLIIRIFEEELMEIARRWGQDAVEWLSFEVNPMKIWNRLELDNHLSCLRSKIGRVNRLKDLNLSSHERIDPSTKNTALLSYLQTLRHDWQRGKVQQRHKDRLRREQAKKFTAMDILWHKVR